MNAKATPTNAAPQQDRTSRGSDDSRRSTTTWSYYEPTLQAVVRDGETLAHLGWTRKFAKAAHNNKEFDGGKTLADRAFFCRRGGSDRINPTFRRSASTVTNGAQDLGG
jgi:hypothetical protein